MTAHLSAFFSKLFLPFLRLHLVIRRPKSSLSICPRLSATLMPWKNRILTKRWGIFLVKEIACTCCESYLFSLSIDRISWDKEVRWLWYCDGQLFYTNSICCSMQQTKHSFLFGFVFSFLFFLASNSPWSSKQPYSNPPNIPWEVHILELSHKSSHAQSDCTAGWAQEKRGKKGRREKRR